MKRKFKSTLAIVLSLAVMFTFIPIMGGTATAATKLKAPTNVTAVADKDSSSVTISWNKVKTAKSYIVYKKVDGKFVKVDSVTDATCTVGDLDADETYTFAVKACKTKTGKSAGSISKNVVVNINNSFDPVEDVKADAEKMYAASDDALTTCEEVANTLAFDPEYWDSNEGWRTAGSDAEHKAAEYLKSEWEKIGLEVSMDRVDLDKFQFNDARISVSNGDSKYDVNLGSDAKIEDEDTSVISYAVSGTKQRLEKENLPSDYYSKGLEVVYMEEGTQTDYAKYYARTGYTVTDMSDKLVLVGVDQWNKVWATQAYNEAYTQGAEGVIVYQQAATDDGYTTTYAAYDDDTNHVQDICSKDLGIPCVDISKNNALKIIEAINNAPEGQTATMKLYVDSEIVDDGGYGYNVVGKIPGKSNTGQQILYAGHYDKYFYGYEDDCLAVGLVAGIAKAMVDSGYEPENDIYFIAHCAEEWGQTDTDFDWAIGSWEEISSARTEWQGSTLALFNFELPGIENDNAQVIVSSAENADIAGSAFDTELFENAGLSHTYISKYSPTGFVCADTMAYEDFGVPCYMNYTNKTKNPDEGVIGWYQNRYHTNRDTTNDKAPRKDSENYADGEYSSVLMQDNIKVYGGLGMATDQTPANVLDLTARCDLLDAALTKDSVATKAQKSAYKSAVKKMRTAAKKNSAKGNAINSNYVAACKAGDIDTASKAKKSAVSYNKSTLKAFQTLHQGTVGIEVGGLYCDVKHNLLQDDYNILNSALNLLKKGKNEDAFTKLCESYGWFGWAYGMSCSEDTLKTLQKTFVNDADNWGRNVEMLGGLSTTLETMSTLYKDLYFYESVDKNKYVKTYTSYVKEAKSQTQKLMKDETKAINKAAKGL